MQLANSADIVWVLNNTPFCPVDDTKLQQWHKQWIDNSPDSLHIPHRAMDILGTLGITDIGMLVNSNNKCKGQHVVMDMLQLKRTHGHRRVTRAHCVALNQVTLALNAGNEEERARAVGHRSHTPLPPTSRLVHERHRQWAAPTDIFTLASTKVKGCKMMPLEHLWRHNTYDATLPPQVPPGASLPTQLPHNLPPATQPHEETTAGTEEHKTQPKTVGGAERKRDRTNTFYLANKRNRVWNDKPAPTAGPNKDPLPTLRGQTRRQR